MQSSDPVTTELHEENHVMQPELSVTDGAVDKLAGEISSLQFARSHELYLRQEQTAYLVPVIFEDGMDFHECAQYYASLNTQEYSARGPCLRKRLQRKTSIRELQQLMDSSPSCLRRSRRNKSKIDLRHSSKVTLETAKLRRCSFNGTAPVAEERPTLQRSNSHRDVKESSPGVSFDQYVQVVTIPSAFEYPDDIRSRVWMSREEMRSCMQKAVAEKVAERRRELMRQQEEAERRDLEEKKEGPQRQNSDVCVMAECQHTSERLAI